MRPLLEIASTGEMHIGEAVDLMAKKLELSEEEISELLPSGRQTKFDNRVRWAKTYLKQAGLLEYTRRGHFKITERGRAALAEKSQIDNDYLRQFEEFQEFQGRSNAPAFSFDPIDSGPIENDEADTPNEIIRRAYESLNRTLAAELLDKVRAAPPTFFESLIIQLLLSMGYGGSSEEAGRALGRSGDGGVDGVIDQDPLGVDQIYVQAKRYADGNNVGPSEIRDFFGALNIKRAQKGIFFTTSKFSADAFENARSLGSRIVLIDGQNLARLMIQYAVGCRDEETLTIRKIDEEFFDYA